MLAYLPTHHLHSTRDYVAAAYASIFARTPPAQLQGRAINLPELKATVREIASALKKKKHGTDPQIITHSLEKVEEEIEICIERGIPLSLPWWCRKSWGDGTLAKVTASDVWEVEGYRKATLEELVVDGKLKPCRDIPPQVVEAFDATFQ